MMGVLKAAMTTATLWVAATGGYGQMQPGTAPPAPAIVPKYGVFEVVLTFDDKVANPFADARASAVFTSPAGKRVEVEGFHDGGNRWKVRFAPRLEGRWKYTSAIRTLKGKPGKTPGPAGEFVCKGSAGRGFLRPSERNPYRLQHEDGTPFYPVGIQTCGYFQVGFDGPEAGGGRRWRTVPAEQWCKAFEGAVNLIRWQLGAGTTAGCALSLIAKDAAAIDRYDLELAAKMDALMRLQRTHGFRHIMILFQDMSLWGNGATAFGSGRDLKQYKSLRAKNLPQQEQMLRYVVARWGCWVDIWELFNEDSYAPSDYLAHLAKVVREADPYDHPVTTNYARPREPWCEIVTWHEYMGMPPSQVDSYITKVLAGLKSHGKVVLNTEFGNQGKLSNHDPVKWRIAVWTAFMNESSLLFWGMSGRKLPTGRKGVRGNANAYIGPESRRYFRVLNEFTGGLPIDMRPVRSGYTAHDRIRTYALSNGKTTVLYVHHFADHTKPYKHPGGLFVTTGPGRFRATWIDPADGRRIRTDEITCEQDQLTVNLPPVTIDAACRIDRQD